MIAVVAGLAILASGCARAPAPPPAVAVVPPPVAAPAPLPPGAAPGMTIPLRLPDGTYPTPNRALTGAAALWHLRAGLNVAALSCDAALAPRYNALLTSRKAELAKAFDGLRATYKTGGGKWEARFDEDMTKLYNYFSQIPARTGLCAAADAVLTKVASMPGDALDGGAPAMLAEIDRPFTDFYRAYDAWRATQPAAGTIAATTPPRPTAATLTPPRSDRP